jgi:HlyD family secretion protein
MSGAATTAALFSNSGSRQAASSLEFAPALVRLQEAPPAPMGRAVLYTLLSLLAALLAWAWIGQLDVVAVAEGKLVPQSFLKIVQPADAGIVREILVKEGEAVRKGQVLMRMDSAVSDADGKTLEQELLRKSMLLHRIDAELNQREMQPLAGAPHALFDEINAQFHANRAALEAALASERATLQRAQGEMSAAIQVQARLIDVLPHYRDQDAAFEKLVKAGFAGTLMASDKRRERVEKEQELSTQGFVIESARASIAQSEKRLLQIRTDHRKQLYAERNEIVGQLEKLMQELAKQAHRQALLELRASQDGVVKDLATHTAGTVVQPGTVLLTVVPKNEALRAEVWVSNQDIGFVREGQPVKLKFATFPFQQYGMVEGTVERVSVDAADGSMQGASTSGESGDRTARGPNGMPLAYRAVVALQTMQIGRDNERLSLSAGMQTSAEVLLGQRSVMEYLLSPVRKAFHEAARER